MPTKLARRNSLYGYPSPMSLEFPAPIIMERAPTNQDQAEIGQLWIDKLNAAAYICAQKANNLFTWINAPTGAGLELQLVVDPGDLTVTAGDFEVTAGNATIGGTLEVTGAATLVGGLTSNAAPSTFGDTEILGEVDVDTSGAFFRVITDTGDIEIGNDPADHSVEIGSATGVSPMLLLAGTGGMGLRTTGNLALASADGAGLALGDSTIEQHAFVGSEIGASSTTIKAGTGGLFLETAGITSSEFIRATNASPTAAATIDANIGQAVFTGFTTAAAASQTFTINNALIVDREPVFVSVSRKNVGAGDVLLQVLGTHQEAGVLTIEVGNTGTDALADDVLINFWVMSH